MFILALIASFVTIAMIFAAPLSQSFRDLPYSNIYRMIKAHDERHAQVMRVVDVMREVASYTTKRDLPAIIMPSNAGSTLRGLPAVQPTPEDAGIFVDAGVRCHQSITYTPHI